VVRIYQKVFEKIIIKTVKL